MSAYSSSHLSWRTNHSPSTHSRHPMLPARQRSFLMLAVAIVLAACVEPTRLAAAVASHARAELFGSVDFNVAAVDYTLTSFDVGTLLLSGETTLVDLVPPNAVAPPIFTFNASFAPDTRFVAAELDRYHPGDPYCPAAAANYNASLGVSTSDGGFFGVIGDLAANHCHARVLVDRRARRYAAFSRSRSRMLSPAHSGVWT